MSRDQEDEGRPEAYDDDGSQAAASGVLVGRYAPAGQQLTEAEADRLAQRDALQDMTDSGRVVHGQPWLRMARNKARVKHRQWERRSNGWAHCKRPRCGFAVPASDDALKIVHQDSHKEADRIARLQSVDYDAQQAVNADQLARHDALAEEVAMIRLRLDVLMVATGHGDTDALQAVVERIMGYAREVNARRNRARESPE